MRREVSRRISGRFMLLSERLTLMQLGQAGRSKQRFDTHLRAHQGVGTVSRTLNGPNGVQITNARNIGSLLHQRSPTLVRTLTIGNGTSLLTGHNGHGTQPRLPCIACPVA